MKHIETPKPKVRARSGRIFLLPHKRGSLGEEEQP